MIRLRRIRAEEIPLLKNFAPPEWNTNLAATFGFHFGKSYFHPFVAESNGELVGCANAIINGNAGWLGNIIVLPGYRNQGIGQALTRHLVGHIKNNGCKNMVLIATKMGEPIYYKEGFRTVAEYIFLQQQTTNSYPVDRCIRCATVEDHEPIRILDRELIGEDRAALLENYLNTAYVFAKGMNIGGFFLPTLGNGLIVSRDPDAGIELLKFRLNLGSMTTVIPSTNMEARCFLLDQGFIETSRAPRMILGEDTQWQPQSIFSRGSGYCG